jgi:hypothetical protein
MTKDQEKDRKPAYDPPRILASYSREELLETVRPHGSLPSYGIIGGCGCS